MTPELQSALDGVRALAQIDDLYQREIEKVFESGGELYCEIQPHGNSAEIPVLQLVFPNGHRKIWYPQDGVSPAEKERQQDAIEGGIVRFKTRVMTQQLLEILHKV